MKGGSCLFAHLGWEQAAEICRIGGGPEGCAEEEEELMGCGVSGREKALPRLCGADTAEGLGGCAGRGRLPAGGDRYMYLGFQMTMGHRFVGLSSWTRI